MHIKDRQTPENGKANLAWGTGTTPSNKKTQIATRVTRIVQPSRFHSME